MPENKKSEKGDYLTKDEMMSFLKSKVKELSLIPKQRIFLDSLKIMG